MPFFRSLGESVDLHNDILDEETVELEEGAEYDGPGITDKSALMEALLVDAVSRMDDESRQDFLNSETFSDLEEAAGVGKRSIVRMNKMDDFQRRLNLASLQKAKEMGDADWELLRKNRIQERKLQERIFKKYNNKVKRDVMMAQKQMLKINPQIFNTLRAVR